LAKVLPFLPLFNEPAQLDQSAPAPPDAEARRRALDIHRSFIVEAPAGSGKTGLLIQRFLKLLADRSVAEPEQVLAITFTNKATAELRDRVLAHLEAVRRSSAQPVPVPSGEDGFDLQTRSLALAVLARDRQLGWALLDHPHRLNIRTIDSVCAEIARTLPVLSGSGGRLAPTEDAAPLHNEAARRTLLLLGTGNDPAFDGALRDLLLHRDNNLANCETLIADMLRLRDQWGDLIPLTQTELDDAYLEAHVLPRLERALDHAICATLARLEQIFPAGVLTELSELAAELGTFDGYNGAPSPIAVCADCPLPPEAVSDHLEHWRALIHLLMTADDWRKERGMTRRNLAFDYDRKHRNHPRLVAIIDQLSGRDDLLAAFESVRELPPARYPANQWALAKSLFRVLSRALVELQIVFAERNQCDFTELSLLARRALGEESGAEDLAAALGARLQHVLVDEMQDTSTGQYELLELLTKSWDGYSQTVFLVGDPLQSIYLFRRARVERFIRALHTQRLGDVPLATLHLTANFRSQRALVTQFNDDFSLIFPADPNSSPNSVPYSNADATQPASTHSAGRAWHANPLNLSAPDKTSAQLRQRQAGRDAVEIIRIARHWFAEPLPPGRRIMRDESGREFPEPWKIAVLVRSRAHLNELISALNKFNGHHPGADRILVRAVEIETLHQRQEVLDLTALTRALLHPADRVAALAVLRAPWCGLSLTDLHALTGADDPVFKDLSISRLIEERGHLLPDEACQRLANVWNVLASATSQRARLTTAQLVERAWLSLGGDAWLHPTQLTNARRFFQLLDTLEAESPSLRIDLAILEERLERLYAEPDTVPLGSPCIELLTIHKAKGLEWDVVLVPALERSPGRNPTRLLNWSEIDSPAASDADAAHIMLAPIAAKGDDLDPLYRWLNRIQRDREAAERKRLFYVACTRARQELHLFAAPDISVKGDINPRYDSLLESAWPAASPHFAPPEVAAATSAPQPSELALAATADPFRPVLQRLPLAFNPAARFTEARNDRLPYGETANLAASAPAPFSRPEGSFAARSFGNAVHACLQILADRILAQGAAPAALLAELPSWTPRIAAILRADGLPRATVHHLARDTRAALENTLRDPNGLWLLASHPGGNAELAVTALTGSGDLAGHTTGRAESVRIDRIFNAGPEPHAPGEDYLWIIDYKTTTHGPTGLDDFLAAQRSTYGPQLQTYARILAPARSRPLHQVRLALYFPTIPRLIWWPAPTTQD
jgi:ATP-dependent exoDNAse (exonuclease V) beta subunit